MANIERRISKSGKVSYRVLIRLKGQPTQSATFERKTDAKLWAQKTESSIRERRYFKTYEAQKHTVSDLIDRYLEQVKSQSPKKHKDLKSKMNWWKKELGYCILADMSKALLSEKLYKLSQRTKDVKGQQVKVTGATVNRYRSALSHACTVATNEWDWLESNPFQKIRKEAESRGRTRFLSDGERKCLLAACAASNSPYLYIMVVLALSTGARRGEIMKLTWSDIDLQREAIVLMHTKNGDPRRLALKGYALELMSKHSKVRRISTDLVFPSLSRPDKPYEFAKAWEKALIEAQVQNFRFHDLRHSFASYLIQHNGASPAVVAELMGHKTLQMVKRYTHLCDSHAHTVVEDMNERIFS